MDCIVYGDDCTTNVYNDGPEEYLMKDWAMAIVAMLIYGIFMLAWLTLMKRTLTHFTVQQAYDNAQWTPKQWEVLSLLIFPPL